MPSVDSFGVPTTTTTAMATNTWGGEFGDRGDPARGYASGGGVGGGVGGAGGGVGGPGGKDLSGRGGGGVYHGVTLGLEGIVSSRIMMSSASGSGREAGRRGGGGGGGGGGGAGGGREVSSRGRPRTAGATIGRREPSSTVAAAAPVGSIGGACMLRHFFILQLHEVHIKNISVVTVTPHSGFVRPRQGAVMSKETKNKISNNKKTIELHRNKSHQNLVWF